MICTFCSQENKGNYCSNCGERYGVKKITLLSITEEAISTVTNMDKGFLYNMKTLFIKPKEIINDYIQGRRKGILNPISFLIITVTLYLLIVSAFPSTKEKADVNMFKGVAIYEVSYKVGRFIHEYFKNFCVLLIFPLGLTTKMIFKRYNFIEHLTISSFIIGQSIFIGIISYMIFKSPLIFDPIFYLAIGGMIFRIFGKKNDVFDSSLSAFAVLIMFGILLILSIAIPIIIMI
ncbi:DUF3667 domain-containing protein [Aquimarina rhabdastrellae]